MEKYKQENQITSVSTSEHNETKKDEHIDDSVLAAIQYRDRAKERREKYGAPEPPFRSDIRDRLGIDKTDYSSSYSKSKTSSGEFKLCLFRMFSF